MHHKLIVSSLLIVPLCLSLGACGDDGVDTSTTDADPSASETNAQSTTAGTAGTTSASTTNGRFDR